MRRPAFTLEQLRSFVAVAEEEHISRAAASLYLTQGAVTQQVRHFERAIGVQLLERDGRRVRLTDAGRSVAVACRAALRAIEVVEETGQSMKTLTTGSLHVGASPTCASHYLPARLAAYAGLHPGVKLDVTVEPTNDVNAQVVAGTLDCGLIEGEPFPELEAKAVAHDELILVVHRDHPLSALKVLGPDDLARYRYLRRGPAFSAEHLVRPMIGEAYDRVDTLDLGHPEYIRSAALAGLGFAALPRLAVAGDLKAGLLVQLPVPTVMRAISAVRRPSQGGPALEEFWRLLTDVAPPASERIYADGGVRG